MNPELAKHFVAILNAYEDREISAEEALIKIQIAVAENNELCEICLKAYPAHCTCPSGEVSTCADCGRQFSFDDEGGFLWEGKTFCEDCDPQP